MEIHLWHDIKSRFETLQTVLDGIGHRGASPDLACPLFYVSQKSSGDWQITAPKGLPFGFFPKNTDILDAVKNENPGFENCVPRNSLFQENPKNLNVLGINLALIEQFGEAAHVLLTLRDDRAPSYPNCFNFPGGCATENPSITGVKELNEEAAVFVRQGNKLHHIRLSLEGETRIDEEMRQASLGVVQKRLSAKYGDLSGLDIVETTVKLNIDSSLGNGIEKVDVLDEHGNVASTIRGIVNPSPSDFSVVIPVKADWKAAGLEIASLDQIMVVDREKFGREMGFVSISKRQADHEHNMPHVSKFCDVHEAMRSRL